MNLKTRPRISECAVPTNCFYCNTKNSYREIIKTGEAKIKGETFIIEYPCFVCSNCGHTWMTPKQANVKVSAVFKAQQSTQELVNS